MSGDIKPATPNAENVTSLQLTGWLPPCRPAPSCPLVFLRLFISKPTYLITAFCWVLKTAGAKEAVKAERMQDGLRWHRLALFWSQCCLSHQTPTQPMDIFSCQSASRLAPCHRTQIAPYFGQIWLRDPACHPWGRNGEVNASICSPNKLSL